jgi:hypothetical protein
MTREDLCTTLHDIRTTVVNAKVNTEMFEDFQTNLRIRYEDLESLIEMTAEVHVDYLCLRSYVKRDVNKRVVSFPMKTLYTFLLQYAYNYPAAFFTHDDIDGTYLSKLRLALQTEFMPICICITYPIVALDTDVVRVII